MVKTIMSNPKVGRSLESLADTVDFQMRYALDYNKLTMLDFLFLDLMNLDEGFL